MLCTEHLSSCTAGYSYWGGLPWGFNLGWERISEGIPFLGEPHCPLLAPQAGVVVPGRQAGTSWAGTSPKGTLQAVGGCSAPSRAQPWPAEGFHVHLPLPLLSWDGPARATSVTCTRSPSPLLLHHRAHPGRHLHFIISNPLLKSAAKFTVQPQKATLDTAQIHALYLYP